MPFKSKAQQRYFFAAEDRGELPKGTAREWAEETDFDKIPERKGKKNKKKKEKTALYVAGQQHALGKYL